KFGAQECRTELSNQFLRGFRLQAKSHPQLPIEPRGMAGPMNEFMEKRRRVMGATTKELKVRNNDVIERVRVVSLVLDVALLDRSADRSQEFVDHRVALIRISRLDWCGDFVRQVFTLADIEDDELLQHPYPADGVLTLFAGIVAGILNVQILD